MLIIKIFLTLSILFFFNACGKTIESKAPTEDTKNVITEESVITLIIDAGSDKVARINKLLTIKGKGRASDDSKLSYEWKKNNKTLGTSAILEYKPTVLGIDTLSFFVKHKNGKVLSDTIKITVIETQSNIETPSISSSLIEEYLTVINKARGKNQDCGKKGKFPATFPLTWNNKLYTASYEHTYDLANSNVFAHEGSGTISDWTGYALGKKSVLSERIDAHNYDWVFIGENIGAGTFMDDATKMVDGWLESDGHCANLMNPKFENVGMAMIQNKNSKYTYYWTQDFGTER